ncbi:MAG: SCP2 sterol-binding domain-containing protein, partial [Marmoricola sp.]
GVEPIRYAVADGVLLSEPPDRVDCTITADPQTFLRMGIGVVSQTRAALGGKLRAGGRRPWLALATTRLFPPIPHGGVR